MTTKVQLVSNIVGNVSGGASFTGIVTASSFVGNLTGTASTATASATAYGLTGSPNITVGNIVSGNINSSGIVTATSFVGSGANLTNLNIPATSDWRDASLFS